MLAVDDEKAGLDEIAHMLESNPRVAQVLTAVDAAEALRIMRGDETSQPFVDAVFADLSMPGLNGMELARVLTAFRNPPALVFITGITIFCSVV